MRISCEPNDPGYPTYLEVGMCRITLNGREVLAVTADDVEGWVRAPVKVKGTKDSYWMRLDETDLMFRKRKGAVTITPLGIPAHTGPNRMFD